MLSSSNDLTVPILDSLSNLTLEADVQNKARRQCLSKIESADVDDLPVVIRFLLQSVPTPEAVSEVVKVAMGVCVLVSLTFDQGPPQIELQFVGSCESFGQREV